jgi:hypothetical protein
MKSVQNALFVVGYFLRRAHWLSLDVVLGAMLMHAAAYRLPDRRGQSSWASTLLVGMAVFVIYTLDRFLDNRKTQTPATARHRFYDQQRDFLLKVVIGLAVVGFVLLFWLPFKVIVFGLIISLLAGLYLWVIFRSDAQHTAQLWKEPIVAIIYTLGVWMPSILVAEPVTWESYALMFLFGLVAFQNLLLFSWMESFDLDEGYSLAIAWGTEAVAKIISILAVVVSVAGIVMAVSTTHHYASRTVLTLAMMSFLTYLVKHQAPQLLPQERYRWLGDGVFLLAVWLW